MADDDQKLTEEGAQKVIAWLKERGMPRGPQCPSCGNQSWHVAEDLVASPIFSSRGGMVIGGSVYPQVMLVCKICALTLFFNAVVMGILEPENDEQDTEDSAKKESEDVKKQEAKNG